jgi:hypothetical protein
LVHFPFGKKSMAVKDKKSGQNRSAAIARRVRKGAFFTQLGPGLITGAADDDPSGIATYTQAGAQFGANMLWTMALTYPLMTAVQLVSAQIGRVTGCGLAKNLGDVLPRSAVLALVALLFAANTINIGADLAAMSDATRLALGGSRHVYTALFALLSLTLQLFISYERYAAYLKWLTLVLLSYVAVVFLTAVSWQDIIKGLVWPSFTLDRNSLTVIVAVFGTTISPYMFFWQSSQEVEEIDKEQRAKPLVAAPRQAPRQLARIWRFRTSSAWQSWSAPPQRFTSKVKLRSPPRQTRPRRFVRLLAILPFSFFASASSERAFSQCPCSRAQLPTPSAKRRAGAAALKTNLERRSAFTASLASPRSLGLALTSRRLTLCGRSSVAP